MRPADAVLPAPCYTWGMGIRRAVRTTLLLASCLLLAAGLAAQTAVGTIDAITGLVEIDAFGAGRFIRAQEGDRLYEETVVRTGTNGRATLLIGEQAHDVPPRTTVAIATILPADRHVDRGFLRRLIQGISDAIAPPREAPVAAGTDRASIPEQRTGSAHFNDGKAFVADRRFDEAIDSLERIDVDIWPWVYDFTVEEHYVYTTLALIGMGDPQEALYHAFDFIMALPKPAIVDRLSPRLRFLVAIAADRAGESELALAAAAPSTELSTPAHLGFAIRSLRVLGYTEEAASLEADARAQLPGTDWDGLLAAW